MIITLLGAGTLIFDVKIEIEVISVQERDGQCHVIMQVRVMFIIK